MTIGTCQIALVTPHVPGAVAMLQLTGDVLPMLEALTGSKSWPIGAARLATIAAIDDGLVTRLREDVALLMPHGGLRIVHRIAEAAVAHGAELASPSDIDPLALYPEAEDVYEAHALAALARAESPLAIDLLLDQPRRWREATAITEEDRQRSRRLNRLITPPLVVLAGPPNVGKSTLTNALIGRSVSIAADMPGTTRDYTAGRINLAGLVVDWFDTPGIRTSDDAIEQKSIAIAKQLFARADLVIAMIEPGAEWPSLPRDADLRVVNKCDLAESEQSPDAIYISALTGKNIPALAAAIRQSLVSDEDIAHPGPWLFVDGLCAPT